MGKILKNRYTWFLIITLMYYLITRTVNPPAPSVCDIPLLGILIHLFKCIMVLIGLSVTYYLFKSFKTTTDSPTEIE